MKPDLYWIGGAGPARLAIMARPRGGDWLADELIALREAGVNLVVCLLTEAERIELRLVDEAACAGAAGLDFLSLPIPDMGVPFDSGAALKTFMRVHDALGRGHAVAVHCRAGVGRSALVVASVMALQGVPPADAWPRIEAARGRPVPETEAQREWVARFARSQAKYERPSAARDGSALR